jgi:hypothetical protein
MALLAVEGGSLPTPPAEHPNVSGVVVDIPASGGFATVVALTDNTTSLYTSTGGGTIGAGGHADVAAATHALLTSVEHHFDSFPDRGDASLPPVGLVRFHLLSESGARVSDVPEDAFWGRVDHSLMPVIAATQNLISAIQSV